MVHFSTIEFLFGGVLYGFTNDLNMLIVFGRIWTNNWFGFIIRGCLVYSDVEGFFVCWGFECRALSVKL